MLGIVIVSHGNLARELLAATEHVIGKQSQCSVICIGPDDDMEVRREEIIQSSSACNSGDGVVILTDMFGGTPSNLAISVLKKGQIEVIAGANLPMLIKLCEVRSESDLNEAAIAAQEAGKKYISIASAIMEKTG